MGRRPFSILTEILNEVSDGSTLYRAILNLWATGDLGDGLSMPLFEKEIQAFKKGLHIMWDDLGFYQKNFIKL